MTNKPQAAQTTPKKRGRPISKHTPAEKKQISLEEEARAFYEKKVQEAATTLPSEVISLRNFYAANALSGLIASGRSNRPDELVDEAFRYADFMLRFAN